jgi:AraC-like DNA-binding protein
MPLIEAALRGGALALLALLAVVRLREARRSPAALYAGLFALSVAAYVVESAPEFAYLPVPWLVPIRIVSCATASVFWLFAVASFDDEFEASWRDALPWLGLAALGSLCIFGHWRRACLPFQAVQLLFVALAVRQAIVGRAADLVEERRRFRVVFVVSAGLYTAAVVVLNFVLHGPPAGPPLSTGNAAGLLVLTFALTVAQLTVSDRGQFVVLAPARADATPLASRRSTDGASAPLLETQDQTLLQRLQRLMDEEKIYREEGLSIAGLAARLEVPEYRLRRLINQRMGHRNFSTFVNGYRLADAMAALADPGQASVPIVTIALDAGFQSLGPFNRAFKAHTGMTPTDYRRRPPGAAARSARLADSEIGKPG